MKKILIVFACFSLFSTACHYGADESKDSLKRNDTYKEINGEHQSPVVDENYIDNLEGSATETLVTPVDSTVKETK